MTEKSLRHQIEAKLGVPKDFIKGDAELRACVRDAVTAVVSGGDVPEWVTAKRRLFLEASKARLRPAHPLQLRPSSAASHWRCHSMTCVCACSSRWLARP